MTTQVQLMQERASARLAVIAGVERCRVGSCDGAHLCCDTCGYPFDNGDAFYSLPDDSRGSMYCSRACVKDDPATVGRCVDIVLLRKADAREDRRLAAMLREAGDL